MSANKPNIEQIRKYLKGELDARAMFELERQAEQDPFLWDVIRGMESSNENHEPNLNAIDELIKVRIEQDKRRIVPMWKYLSVAASLLIALGIGGWWLKREPVQAPIVANRPKVELPDKVKVELPAPAAKPVLPQTDAEQVAQIKPKRYKTTVSSADVSAQMDKADTARNLIATNNVTDLYKKKASDASANSGYMEYKSVNAPQPGAADKIRIRGMASIGAKSPMYVVDGVPVTKFDLNSIKQEDIKSIDILKDTAAFAIYGSRAAQGVVVVNTKKPAGMLKEVSVIGYGTVMKKDVTGAVSTIGGIKDIKGPDTNITEALAGRGSGVQVVGVSAQKGVAKTITGKVVDKDNHTPLPGVSIRLEGTGTATTTDAFGAFKIAVPGQNATLYIAYVGYTGQQVKVKDKDKLDITLSSNSNSLSEVVVVGYGGEKREVEIVDAHPSIGWKAYNQYLKDKAVMPDGKTGVVKVSFTIEVGGTISNIKVVKGLTEDMNKKALELIQTGSGWIAESDRKPQEVKIRIKFRKPEKPKTK
ncbi:MAG: TonB family protein [Mucilaginibacter sp.]|uniref:TonB family protein n=1 Tax=Mucilaginibacter sp. TaxID=1882438 RepID=UPI003264A2FF